ncbi:hypothetical protein CXZ10_17435 [Pleomorphomonas diazotrophica]|uniref:EF-hand domain-containing protein n=1 Tax=Pleomorphomonas diazotrophica TaxID=1166257 RepID=A0A1I4W766_9HYPH|nr:hypothetical protein [Pleomorphomonas diazotrophica]PKR87908.1 hypothetical protein CXZ10_17435 [Pleomorphomonas diazotrophica]SFN09056.1 hypothetical protein SAMN05192571_11562 [Pleomorphomonas diazotrophica]
MRLLLALLLATAASASQAATDNSVFVYAMRPNVVFEAYVGHVLSPLRYFQRGIPEGSTAVPASEIALYERAAERRWVRAVNAAMRADIDGNDRLDRSELGQAGVEARKIDELFRLFGKNEHAAVSRHEFNTVTEPRVVAAHAYLRMVDGDEIHLQEVLDRATRAFREVDANGDLEISASEYRSVFGDVGADANEPSLTRDTVTRLLINLLRDASDMTLPPGSLDCAMPRPSSGAEIVLVGVHDGAAVSDVYIGSPEKQTTTAEIAIKAGSEPLYIILSTDEPMIWRFTGATDRVERVVLSGFMRAHSGAVGISADKLALADGDERDVCVPSFHDVSPGEGRLIGDRVAAAIGRRPGRIAATYSVAKLLVTAMDFEDTPVSRPSAPPGFDLEDWRAAAELAPAGLVSIDPGKVAAFAPAAKYKVLPITLGIGGPLPSLPAGSTGTRSGKFGLNLTVAGPEGSAGQSCRDSEEPGKPLPPGCR